MAMRRRTAEERDWLLENVPKMRSGQCRDAFMEKFGWLPSQTAWDVWNGRRGLHHDKVGRVTRRCERRVRWSEEPEMEAWMLEHDQGRDTKTISEEFRAVFGFGLTQTQITGFRQSHGTTTRRAHGKGGAWHERPVGYEIATNNGYIKVKVREKAEVPGSKDNWEFKHHLVWKQAHGTEVPEGCDIMFADGDMRNFDPENLVAVPHKLQAQLKTCEYWDAESLEAAVAMCMLHTAIIDAKSAHKVCPICGKRFAEDARQRDTRLGKTVCCPDCARDKAWLKSGNAAKFRKPKGWAECAVCGKRFAKTKKTQKRCPECIAEKPRHSAERHRAIYRKEQA